MILILGGTDDAIKLGRLLEDKGYDVVISTATSYGKKIVDENNLKPFNARLNGNEMDQVLKKEGIKAVIDVTHPYSTKVTYNARAACKKSNTPLLRLERPKSKIPAYKAASFTTTNKIYYVKDFHEAAEKSFALGKRILITTGSKDLEPFVDKKKMYLNKKLYVRILPEKESIIKCQNLGLTPGEIIALKGPIDYKLNKALLKSYDISVLVTKDSGDKGGTTEKLKAALELDIYVVIIERPCYNGILTANNEEEVLSWLKNNFY